MCDNVTKFSELKLTTVTLSHIITNYIYSIHLFVLWLHDMIYSKNIVTICIYFFTYNFLFHISSFPVSDDWAKPFFCRTRSRGGIDSFFYEGRIILAEN